MFKNMSIIFTCVEDSYAHKRTGLKFKIERYRSGATAYGDCSAHSYEIVDHPEFGTKYFDTRYERISTEKESWIKTWKEYLERELLLKVEPDLDSYREEVK